MSTNLPQSDLSDRGAGERLLVTGATGFLGRQLVRILLEDFPKARIVLLVREKHRSDKTLRLRMFDVRTNSARGDTPGAERLQVLFGDASRNRCGLTQEDYERAIEGTTRIIHAAATVRFDSPPAEARSINVEGTRHLLELASDAQRHGTLRSFTYIGTAFVAGEREGIVREDELDVGQRFRNIYEETKCAAEKLVRSQGAQIPSVILRPSIIVGDSRTGVTSSFRTMYWPLKVYAKRGWRLLPGFPDTVVDIVPVDFVARAAAHIAMDDAAAGHCLHLCAGRNGGATLKELALRASSFFHKPPPRFVDPAVFLTLLRPLLLAVIWGPRRRVLLDGPVYRPYFRMRLVFDTTQADKVLTLHGIRPPKVLDYFDRVLRYCVDSDWGRRRAVPSR
jgi:nucleoside-diphosphate-sugar epimerase